MQYLGHIMRGDKYEYETGDRGENPRQKVCQKAEDRTPG